MAERHFASKRRSKRQRNKELQIDFRWCIFKSTNRYFGRKNNFTKQANKSRN